MNDALEYKDYLGSVHYSAKDKCFYGKLEGLEDTILFEGVSVSELEMDFREAVEDYLKTCKAVGKKAQKTYRGLFNVRISPDLHRLCAQRATKTGVSLNKFVEASLKKAVEEENVF